MIAAIGMVRAVRGRRLLDGVSVAFEAGRLHAILGPNGAGKSTLLRALAGQAPLEAGEVRYGDTPLAAFTPAALARRRAVLAQSVELAFSVSAHEVVRMGRYPHLTGAPSAADERVCDEVMELCEVTALRRRDVLTLSGGEAQRVHFARVLAQVWTVPDGVLFLDEPLTSLDIHHQIALLRMLQTLKTRLTVVSVLHDLNLAARFTDRLVLLHDGRLLADGAPEAVLTDDNVERAFQIRPRRGPALIFD